MEDKEKEFSHGQNIKKNNCKMKNNNKNNSNGQICN